MSEESAPENLPSAFLRTVHWLNAVAIIIMIGSGWRIYSWYPALPVAFEFPWVVTLGGETGINEALHNEWGLANALAWHFGAMWLLVVNFLLYLGWGIGSGHFRRDFLPLGPRMVFADLSLALKGKLAHRLGQYNAVQKAFYWLVLTAITVTILSGLSIWKPVQLQSLTAVFGGYETARLIHFLGMAVIVGFLAVHIVLALLVPQTLVAIISGRAWHRQPRSPAVTLETKR